MITQLKLGIFVAALALAGCASATTPPTEIRQIVSTTSFGMCVGYCSTRLEISEGVAVLTRDGRSGRGSAELPDQRFTQTLTPAEWQEFARLAANTNLSGLPPTIGCPDCADGGAESLSINGASPTTFDFNADIAQAQALLDRVRALRTRMTPD
ncbi:MAG: hypothetical protein H7124_03875 [Phycisphaerales bacterium]|nr:hypothetical protein [Hyphomonadaceae bacterium]